jgi:DNA primase
MLKDKFISRLMIPVFNKQGQVTGFTGRVLPDDKTERPKYLNSSESQWFKKSDNWYGWHLAKDSIKKSKEVIIVEGNMDVIAAYQFGFSNVLASQGTAVSSAQVKQLKFLCKRVLVAFDNDNAGLISGNKLFVLCNQEGIEVKKVLINQKYKDLDEYLHNEFQVGMQLQTQDYGEYLLAHYSQGISSENSSVQRQSIEEILAIFAQLDELYREQLLQKLSKLSGISLNTLNTIQCSQMSDITVNSKHLEDINIALVTIQKLIAIQIGGNLVEIYTQKLPHLYQTIKVIVPMLADEGDLPNYIANHKPELELVLASLDYELTEQGMDLLWQQLTNFIRRNWSKLVLFPEVSSYLDELFG